jgi:hypothetical protein
MSGPYDEEEVYNSLRASLDGLSQECTDTKIIVNTIRSFKPSAEGSRGGLIGISYAYLSNYQAYNALVGRNLDGTPRVEYKKMEKDEPDYDSWEGMLENNDQSWFDIMEETPNKEEIQLGPLASPLIPNEDGTVYYLNISPAFVEVIEDLTMNTICIRNVPSDITPEMLKDIFKEYASNSFTKRKIRFKTGTINEAYPLVTVTSKKRGYITYDPKTNDGSFALLMTKRIAVGNHVLHCSHPSRKIRD